MRRKMRVPAASMPQMPAPCAMVQAQVMENTLSQKPWRQPVMNVTIPLFALVAAILYIAWRYMGLRIWQAVLAVLLGFLLAATHAAPEINNIINGVTHWLTKP